MKRLKLCLLSVTVLASLSATDTTAETWKQAPGDTKSYYDADFTRVDQATGLIVTRVAEGKPNGPYKSWPASKGPILVFALDCATDKWMDLGMDFDGSKGLPKGWRKEARIDDISGAVGKPGKLLCETKDSLPKVELP